MAKIDSTNNVQKRLIYCFAPFGYEGSLVQIETDLRRGIPAIDIVGLADNQVNASRERILAAFRNSNLDFPSERVLQSLSPADLRKEGSQFDLAMAVSILNEMNNYKGDPIMVLGELELSGQIRPVRGVHAAAQMANAAGITNIIVSDKNMNEALQVPGMKVLPVASLSDVHEALLHNQTFIEQKIYGKKTSSIDFNEEALSRAMEMNLDGYYDAARAIEIAIAGKHNILLDGAPGCGKTMLLQSLMPGLTPQLTNDESQSTTRIWSLAGLMKPSDGLIKDTPFRMPHQTASIEGICGGGPNCRPGEISLAHHGILFLDEAAEFRSSVLQMMRIPLESHCVTLSRAGRATTYPADFQLAMATNPCPCGCLGSKDRICLCSTKSIGQYWAKFSAPLLDRVEIKQQVIKNENDKRRITVPEMKQHIENAFHIQRENQVYNANLSPQEIAEKCNLSEKCKTYLEEKSQQLGFSPRSQANTLKVALTIANMDNRREISLDDLRESCELNAINFSYDSGYPLQKPGEYKRDPSIVRFENFEYNSYYHSTNTREICHDVKQTENKEVHNKAVKEIASYLSSQIQSLASVDYNIYLVPAPQHTGNAEYTLEIANQMANNPYFHNLKVLDVLKCEPHETLYEQKKNGNRNADLNFYLADGTEIPKDGEIFFVDNVISSGNTFNEANKVCDGKLFPLVYAVSDFAKLEHEKGKNGKVVIKDTRPVSNEAEIKSETNEQKKNNVMEELVIDLANNKSYTRPAETSAQANKTPVKEEKVIVEKEQKNLEQLEKRNHRKSSGIGY